MLYYTLVYSKICFGTIVGATANKTFLGVVQVKLNKFLRIILSCSKFTPILIFYKILNFLQLKHIYLLELAKFMYQLYHSKLPQKFNASFSILNEIQNYNTRNTKALAYFISRINKNFSKSLLFYRGSILWGLMDAEFKGMQWVSLKKKIIEKLY